MRRCAGFAIFLFGIVTFSAYTSSLLSSQDATWNSEAIDALPLMKGMTLNAWSAEAYNSSNFDESIANLADTRANWVLFTIFWFMETRYDTTIQPRQDLYTASDSSLIHAIERAHQLSIHVALKPMVDVVDGTWRGQISPSNWTLWFDNYCSFVNRYSELSEANNVELFVVGTEFKSSQSFEVNWRQVIDSVRTRFSAKVTYAANWDSYSVSWIEFWDALDYVGVDAYFPLTNTFNPTVQQLINAWSYSTASGFNGRNWTNELYATSTQTGKDIIFTEIGYCSQDGTNTEPWNWNISPNTDLKEQADCYNAALEVFKEKTWFKGWFWWNWETDPNAGGPADKHFTPQNKPAQTVLRQYYYEMPPDLAVTKVICSRNIIARGFSLIVNITLTNQGLYTEISNSTVLGNDTLLCEYSSTLENGSSTTITFVWNTTTFSVGNYLLNASVKPILGEIDFTDNSYQYWIIITISGDTDGDFRVQLADLVVLANAYGSMPGMLKWNVNADFDCNDLVGLSDLVMLASNYGNNALG